MTGFAEDSDGTKTCNRGRSGAHNGLFRHVARNSSPAAFLPGDYKNPELAAKHFAVVDLRSNSGTMTTSVETRIESAAG
jgi:hypothetical protein